MNFEEEEAKLNTPEQRTKRLCLKVAELREQLKGCKSLYNASVKKVESLSSEGSLLRKALEKIAAKGQGGEVNIFDMANANIALAALAPVSEEHNKLTDVEHNNLKTVADSASEERATDEDNWVCPKCKHPNPQNNKSCGNPHCPTPYWDAVSEEHNKLTDVEHNNLKTVADSASEGREQE